jgi:hypothetical protein
MVFNNNLLLGAAGAGGGYEIDQSIRFNNDDTPILSRTLGTPTDRNKFTYSFWVKPSSEANGYALETNVTGGVTFSGMVMDGGSMQFFDYSGGSAQVDVRTAFTGAVKFRDYSAWYHAMFVYDSDQGTDSDRLKFYINGVQFPSGNLVGPGGGSPVWPSSGYNSQFNNNVVHRISSSVNGLIDGYMAEINFIDGQALDPTSFGEYNDDGVWIPIEASPTYGNNGFYITGQTASDLGEDFSGNGNDFTSSGLTTADQMPDTPTNNFCTLNPIEPVWGAKPTLSNGNLNMAGASATVWNNAVATFKTLPSTGKWIWAAEPNTSGGGQCDPWIVNETGLASRNNYVYVDANGWETTFDSSSVHTVLNNGASRNASFTYGSGDFHVICFDADSKKLWFGIYDVSAGTLQFHDGSTGLTGDPGAGTNPTYTLTGNEFSIGFATYTGRGGNVDFGQSDLLSQFTAPTGFNTLCTANLPTPSIKDGSAHFQPTLYTGNGSTLEVNQSGNSTFQPDWVWGKRQNGVESHALFDAVRGTTKIIYSNLSNAETTNSGLTAFDADGFTIGPSATLNTNTGTYVAWQWKANGAGSSNTDGDITSTVSANTTAGFSIVKYSGNGFDNQEIGHGLGLAPKMIFTKRLDASGNWTTYNDAVGINKVFYLNSTAAPISNTEQYRAVPTSSVYTVGVGGDINNASGTYVAYCFAEIPGYSSIGTYTGNGSTDGPFVYTGFTPRYVLFKRTNAAESWPILDTARGSGNFGLDAGTGGDNPTATNDLNAVLVASTTAAEEDNPSGSRRASFNSNGFKVRTTNTAMNGSGSTYIYMAFAEHPFGGDSAAPATAR